MPGKRVNDGRDSSPSWCLQGGELRPVHRFSSFRLDQESPMGKRIHHMPLPADALPRPYRRHAKPEILKSGNNEGTRNGAGAQIWPATEGRAINGAPRPELTTKPSQQEGRGILDWGLGSGVPPLDLLVGARRIEGDGAGSMPRGTQWGERLPEWTNTWAAAWPSTPMCSCPARCRGPKLRREVHSEWAEGTGAGKGSATAVGQQGTASGEGSGLRKWTGFVTALGSPPSCLWRLARR
jgi:hypothetical protein